LEELVERELAANAAKLLRADLGQRHLFISFAVWPWVVMQVGKAQTSARKCGSMASAGRVRLHCREPCPRRGLRGERGVGRDRLAEVVVARLVPAAREL
jgi:hypothetical protein